MRYGWQKAGAFAYVAGQRLFAVREDGHRNVRHRIAQERVPLSLGLVPVQRQTTDFRA
jgi:hypothetical protein